ncbi:MAG TPA: asparagine synthase-related protein [Thermoanaerobaculia bacterium]
MVRALGGSAHDLERGATGDRSSVFVVLPQAGTARIGGLAVDPARRHWLALDGRLDDRSSAAARDETGPGEPPDDASLLLARFLSSGDEVFRMLVGPFSVALVDTVEGTVRLARDPVGNRTLFFRHRGAELDIASHPYALAAAGSGPMALDLRSVARYLAARGPAAGSTFFDRIEEVPPGTLLRFSASGRSLLASSELRAASPPGRGTKSDYEERFRELLDRAVDCRVEPTWPLAVLMSGGLDSTSVAATAARLLASRGQSPPETLSWVFPTLPGADESRWIIEANRASGARQHLIAGDELWPLAEEPEWPWYADSPIVSPYWRLRRRSLELARDLGSPALLTGESGDEIWGGGRDWLRDLVCSGRLLEAGFWLLRNVLFELTGERPAVSSRTSLGRLLRSRLPDPQIVAGDWLTAEARELIREDAGTRATRGWSRVAERAGRSTYPLDLAFLETARREAEPFGVEIRRPFRDRQLVEFFLGVPARLLHRPGESKRLLRLALADRLPPTVIGRRQSTSLLGLFDRGMAGPSLPRVRALLDHPDAIWPRFVRRDWLESRAFAALGSREDSIERLILWHCVCVERWRQAIARGSIDSDSHGS